MTTQHEARYQRALSRISLAHWMEVKLRVKREQTDPLQLIARQCHILGVRISDYRSIAAKMKLQEDQITAKEIA